MVTTNAIPVSTPLSMDGDQYANWEISDHSGKITKLLLDWMKRTISEEWRQYYQ